MGKVAGHHFLLYCITPFRHLKLSSNLGLTLDNTASCHLSTVLAQRIEEMRATIIWVCASVTNRRHHFPSSSHFLGIMARVTCRHQSIQGTALKRIQTANSHFLNLSEEMKVISDLATKSKVFIPLRSVVQCGSSRIDRHDATSNL